MDEEKFDSMAYFPIGRPFIVELKFTEANEETAKKLWKSLISFKGGEELLPNLIVTKVWYKDIGSGDVVAQRVADKLGEMATYIADYITSRYEQLRKELTHDDKFVKEHPNIPDSMVNLHEILYETKHKND
ncbi:MAG: hypothetical protein LUD72_13575 [Bacteroidales bacterium]|nr:hypothetical protein [Bacteroidales bacterium]